MPVPFQDLKAQYRALKTEIDEAVGRVLENCTFILGPEVAAFERDFAAYCQAQHCIGVNSGTSALHLALLAAGVGPSDEVITTPFSFVASTATIHYAGATPVYVDIEAESFNIDPAKIEAAITHKTKAIMPVHLYGQCADMDPILEIARRHGIVVIEDAAQAHGAEYKGRRAGSMGDLACFSFYPGKNLGAYGEGGAVTTNNADYAKTIRLLRDWGSEQRYYHKLRGYNYRMEGLTGAILRVKLRHLEEWTEARCAIAREYGRALTGVVTPREMPYARHVYNVYSVRCEDRTPVEQALDAAGVEYRIFYPLPLHLQEAYRDSRYGEGSFPIAERAAREVLALPIFPGMKVDSVRTALAPIAPDAAGQPARSG